ncbi:MAG: ATP-binding protein [Parachlamydiales bacterium]|nr:ATP-binding protein [Parachlamydiales bacterium]
MKKREYFSTLVKRLNEPRRFIQSLIGPRQVGKTTLARQVADALEVPTLYVSADLATLQDITWLEQQWNTVRELAKTNGKALLIVDEIQKIPHWSDMVKLLWDQDTFSKANVILLFLGSSPWLMQKGLSESLAGRFEVIPITHWSYKEMKEFFGWSLNHYLYFGGYPGAAVFSDENDISRWINYINDSIIETTISRDIFLMNQVNKPALLRRLFQLSCNYSGQILSYTKMLGELQDAGNTTTLAHYKDLLEEAGLISGLQKFANQNFRRRGSSPKLAVFNTSLLTAQSGKNFNEAINDPVFYGRLIESAVGAHLLNGVRGTQIKVFYWREGDKEVDFVLKLGDKIIAIEVKSTNTSIQHSGIDVFVMKFKPMRVLLVGSQGIALETFLSTPPKEWFE